MPPLTLPAPATISFRLLRWLRAGLGEPYKHVLGRGIAWSLRATSLDFPPGRWPPSTPARHYIDEFLTRYESEVRGRCVEFAPPVYRERFDGDARITAYEVWDVEDGEGVTIVGDLQDAAHLPDSSFDTILCTHVLCSIPRPWLAVAELHRLLASGGLVLCTNPVVLQRYAPHPQDCWRFTPDSMALLFSGFSRVESHSYGNAATVAGSPLFLMKEHFPRWVLEYHDERAPSVVAIAAWK